MSAGSAHKILAPNEGPVVEVINPGGQAPVCIVCEHASAAIPASLDGLGLAERDRLSHAVWDIGALDLARRLSEALDAPLVAARFSRLVIDCNRPADAPDAIPARTERIAVPGNADLDAAQRARRAAVFHSPFHEAVAERLDAFAAPPALLTIHSFTPVWNGTARDVQLGLLHDSDDSLARRAMAHAPGGLLTRLNAPYGPEDGVTYTLIRHGIARGLPNLMIELRNDLIADADGVAGVADAMVPMLRATLGQTESAA